MNTNPTYVVETEGLTKRFGERVAVDRVDLRIPAGSAFGYLGPNGAGKTTLIRTLLGLTAPSAGTIRLLGRPIPEQRREALARVGAIVEEPRFHPFLTGRENLRVVAAARGREAHGLIPGALERVGLSHRADGRVGSYSLGMRQRLGVARCLLADPELLILDEPMNGLDPAGMEEMRLMIRGLADEGRTVVLSSHLLDEVEKTCDAIAIVDQGRVVAQGSIDELTGDAATVLVSTSDDLRAQALLAGCVVEAIVGGLRVHSDDAALVNRRLVEAGLDVHRLEPERVSLERRFLEITSRLENAA
jgi:ABC-2 type transport system ATP-binding protein